MRLFPLDSEGGRPRITYIAQDNRHHAILITKGAVAVFSGVKISPPEDLPHFLRRDQPLVLQPF